MTNRFIVELTTGAITRQLDGVTLDGLVAKSFTARDVLDCELIFQSDGVDVTAATFNDGTLSFGFRRHPGRGDILAMNGTATETAGVIGFELSLNTADVLALFTNVVHRAPAWMEIQVTDGDTIQTLARQSVVFYREVNEAGDEPPAAVAVNTSTALAAASTATAQASIATAAAASAEEDLATLQSTITAELSAALITVVDDATAEASAYASTAEAMADTATSIAGDVGDTLAAVQSIAAEIAAGGDVAIEASTRSTADASLTTRIGTEETTRSTADASLATSIATEASLRGEMDQNLTLADLAETSARSAADVSLTTRIGTEETTRSTAVASLATSIATEASLRGEMDQNLTLADLAETSARSAADVSLTTRIGTEETTRSTAVSSLATVIGGMVSSITGTAGQITASASTGAVTLSLPTALTDIASITSPAASNLAFGTGSFGTVLTMISATGNIGIGTTAPAAPLEVVGNATAAQIFCTAYSTYSPGFVARKANGTIGSPTAAASGDYLNFFGGRGHTGSAFATGSAGYIGIVASQNWTGSNNGTRIIFATTSDNSTSAAERARLTQTGNLLIGGTSDISGAGGLKVFGTTAATNTTSGALQIGSNIGLSGNSGGPSYFGGVVVLSGSASSRPLDVTSSSTSYTEVSIANSSASRTWTLAVGGSSGPASGRPGSAIFGIHDVNAGISRLTIDTTGQVSIGGVLAVTGQGQFVDISATGEFVTNGLFSDDTSVTVSTTLYASGRINLNGTSNSTPASASATGSIGELKWDTSYLYLCTATDTWKRAALATW